MPEVTFPRNVNKVLAHTNQSGLSIIGAWTIGIVRETAVEYVNTYNTNPNAGFYEHKGSVILSHKDGKITFTPKEAIAIVDLIRESYM